MTTPISIAIPAPYVTVEKFAEDVGMNPRTVRKYVHEGKFPIRKKEITGKYDRSTTLINITALFIEAAENKNPELSKMLENFKR